MKLSIIILNYNTRGLLRQCLKAIVANPPGCVYEIIVIDNHSADGSKEMVQAQFPAATIRALTENRGYAGGNNRGLASAKGEYLAILNPDVLVLPGALTRLVNFLETHADVGMVGPKLLNPDRTLQYSCYHFPSLWIPVFRRTPLGHLPFVRQKIRTYLMADWAHDTIRDVDWLLGGALMVRRRAYEVVGKLDERFFMYFDDVDYARRMHEAGFRVVYNPDAAMIHFHQRESAGSLLSFFTNRVTRIHVYSAIRYFWKWRTVRKVNKQNPSPKSGAKNG